MGIQFICMIIGGMNSVQRPSIKLWIIILNTKSLFKNHTLARLRKILSCATLFFLAGLPASDCKKCLTQNKIFRNCTQKRNLNMLSISCLKCYDQKWIILAENIRCLQSFISPDRRPEIQLASGLSVLQPFLALH